MNTDQATTLRQMAWTRNRTEQIGRGEAVFSGPRVIAIASGKGGVGKTCMTANLAVAAARRGARVLAVDADLGLANLDMAFGVAVSRSFLDVVEGRAVIHDVLHAVGEGIALLPGCSGRYDLANLSEPDRARIFAAIDDLDQDFDVLLVDTGAGIGANAVAFAAACRQVVLVATPEPTSIADAYAVMKVLSNQSAMVAFHIVVNAARSAAEGERVFETLARMAQRFLSVEVRFLGSVLFDAAFGRSIRAGKPVLQSAPDGVAAQCLNAVAQNLFASSSPDDDDRGALGLFWRRFIGGGKFPA